MDAQACGKSIPVVGVIMEQLCVKDKAEQQFAGVNKLCKHLHTSMLCVYVRGGGH